MSCVSFSPSLQKLRNWSQWSLNCGGWRTWLNPLWMILPTWGQGRRKWGIQMVSGVYHIRSIGRHGYYLFHYTILCGFYSRVATIRERCLLSSGQMVKFIASRNVEWLQTPERQSKETPCMLATATDTRPLHECWRGQRWVGGERTCSTRLLIHYTRLSTILKL